METEFEDKILICVDCGEEFVFTASAQRYFAERGFTDDPRRCKCCYMELKRTRRSREKAADRRGSRQRRLVPEGVKARGNGNGSGNGGPSDLSDDF